MEYITSEINLYGPSVAMGIVDPHLYWTCVALVIVQQTQGVIQDVQKRRAHGGGGGG